MHDSIKETTSDIHYVTSSVQQGSVLVPLFFYYI